MPVAVVAVPSRAQRRDQAVLAAAGPEVHRAVLAGLARQIEAAAVAVAVRRLALPGLAVLAVLVLSFLVTRKLLMWSSPMRPCWECKYANTEWIFPY
jgi:hypothetical protein